MVGILTDVILNRHIDDSQPIAHWYRKHQCHCPNDSDDNFWSVFWWSGPQRIQNSFVAVDSDGSQCENRNVHAEYLESKVGSKEMFTWLSILPEWMDKMDTWSEGVTISAGQPLGIEMEWKRARWWHPPTPDFRWRNSSRYAFVWLWEQSISRGYYQLRQACWKKLVNESL